PVDLDDGGVVSSMPCLVREFFVVGNDPVDRLSDHVRNTMSESPLSSAADGQDFSLFIDGEDRVVCGFLDDFVALAQFFHTVFASFPSLVNPYSEQHSYQIKNLRTTMQHQVSQEFTAAAAHLQIPFDERAGKDRPLKGENCP